MIVREEQLSHIPVRSSSKHQWRSNARLRAHMSNNRERDTICANLITDYPTRCMRVPVVRVVVVLAPLSLIPTLCNIITSGRTTASCIRPWITVSAARWISTAPRYRPIRFGAFSLTSSWYVPHNAEGPLISHTKLINRSLSLSLAFSRP